MNLIGYEDQDDPYCRHQVQTKAKIEDLLSDSGPLDWNVVNGLLQRLTTITSSKSRFSAEDDPMGRLLLGRLLSRNPPASSVEAALRVFPDSLSHSPAAFFMACRDASPEVVAQMMRHTLAASSYEEDNNKRDECPYPWIFSSHVSIDGAKALLEVFPQGVLQKSSCLSSYSPLDYFLMSPDMIEQREFDVVIWNKFKLMLVAAECYENHGFSSQNFGISPVHMILKRILSRPDFLDNMKRAQHGLWLLHQLRCSDRWVFEKQISDGRYPIHFVLSQKCTVDPSGLVAARELVTIILQAHPISAKYLVNGRLALHMAIENGWPCHDLLLAVFPEALDVPDPKTGLFPFQTAAKEGMSTTSLDVTFELLRANPTHASCMGKDLTQVGAQA